MRKFFVSLAIGLATVAPSWAQADDEQIAQEIIDKLQTKKDAGELKGFNIDLEVDSGTVWLSGSVATPEQQKIAIDIARRVSGVEKVVNRLKVQGAGSNAASGTPVAATADSPVANADKATPSAPTPAAKQAPRPSLLGNMFAKQVQPAANAPSVETRAETRGETSGEMRIEPVAVDVKTDDQLVQDILARLKVLKQSGQLKGFRMDVQAEDGQVWLSGDVSNPTQQKLVIETVRRVPGVKQVVNDLKIRTASLPASMAGTGVSMVSGTAPVGGEPTLAPRLMANQPAEPAAIGTSVARGPVPGPLPAVPGYSAVPLRVGPAPQSVMVAPAGMAGRVPNRPLAFAPSAGARPSMIAQTQGAGPIAGPETPMPMHAPGPGVGIAPARYDHPNMPGYAWPSYASHPNYAAVTYPKQYSPSAWPYIGPFYPYPQVPLGWRKVTLKWDDGWWNLDFKSK
jgi:osmotically-inducible protein OsmY